ncbi:winged helix-turn-helix domain-containing protein [Streptomyces gobiensis]|uniref:winged helix-turn-helix domain-containing protein n=1 Tax=Streptomyces gobiensis TaxID=2875706 RepID=UPI001E61B626|nr:winged helix-turn-helix domain-containing protein [Streptomyces gobiensis]UGY91649.1 winged helix-turn-helix domain-containing protein [Streptomyces gobiensis]
MEIDYGSYLPPYRQIAAELIADIERGTLRPGRAIPSEPQLVQRYGVARATVRRAVAYLRDQGYVFTIPHRGTYVALEPPATDQDNTPDD